jgi:hypothetical protein
MANTAIPTGEIRPKTPVTLAALEKRLRRALAPRGCSLLKTRPGTQDRNSLGLYAVIDHKRGVIERRANLEALASYLGVMDDHEILVADGQEVGHE